MGKYNEKSSQPTDELSSESSQSDKMQASQDKQHANDAPLSLKDMEKLLKSMEDRIIAKLSDQLSADRATIDRHDQTIQHLETSLSDIETKLATLESTCLALSKENESLKRKTDDLENRSRQYNIRITGLHEKAEGVQTTSFAEIFLKQTFGTEAFSTPPTVDRAHRIAISRKRQGDHPRPFIARIHRYQIKERILNLARDPSADPKYTFTRIIEVTKKRVAYSTVKTQLRNDGLGYRMLFPAKLQVTDKNGHKVLFLSPEEVSSFLQNNRPGTSPTLS